MLIRLDTHVRRAAKIIPRQSQRWFQPQEKLKAAKSPKDVVAIAKEYDHEFTADNIAERSEEELEGVAGCFKKRTNTFDPLICKNPIHYE